MKPDVRSGAILAIDQGTSSTKALLIDHGRVIARASRPVVTDRPRPDWAEQDAEAIWASVVAVVEALTADAPPVAAIALTNQRETAGLWDDAGQPLAPFVLWQCRRSAEICDRLKPLEAEIVARTGLALDPMFSAGKLAWLLDHVPDARPMAAKGRLRAGTVDSWLLWRLTGGAVHATDHSNAARTQLMDLQSLDWDAHLLDLFDIPAAILPTIQPSGGLFGTTAAPIGGLPAETPILAVVGDSHAALCGHGFDEPGAVKATCGTGSSLMTLTQRPVPSRHGLSTTIGWSTKARTRYALEGNIVVSGQTLTFAARLLGLKDEAALFELAARAPDSQGVVLVPAMSGLGAPHWCDHARGLIDGMTLATGPEHLALAAVEGVALQIRDVFNAMAQDVEDVRQQNAQKNGRPSGAAPPPSLSIDGGAAESDMIAQMLADLIDAPVLRPREQNLSAMGAARLAAAELEQDFAPNAEADRFEPAMSSEQRDRIISGWTAALKRASMPD